VQRKLHASLNSAADGIEALLHVPDALSPSEMTMVPFALDVDVMTKNID
jgi:hypothetical protein